MNPNDIPTHVYKVFVNGKLITESSIYDYAMNRGFGIAMYLKLDFVNTKSKKIMDKWTNEVDTVIITKEEI
jgi:hypothetical protein